MRAPSWALSPAEDLMAGTDKRKQSLYFPEDMLREIQEEANRQDRSLSWIVQQAWRISRERVMKMPSVKDALTGAYNREHFEERLEVSVQINRGRRDTLKH